MVNLNVMIYKSNWGKTQENSYKREIFTKKSEKNANPLAQDTSRKIQHQISPLKIRLKKWVQNAKRAVHKPVILVLNPMPTIK